LNGDLSHEILPRLIILDLKVETDKIIFGLDWESGNIFVCYALLAGLRVGRGISDGIYQIADDE
jgi:hypothetical protein